MLCGFTPFWDGGSPVKIYENILKGKVKYPPYIHHDAQDLLVQLITSDLTKRLGNLHSGPADIKNHPWFAEVTWERLVKGVPGMPANLTSILRKLKNMERKEMIRKFNRLLSGCA
jgi:serine/threonine protein kinase